MLDEDCRTAVFALIGQGHSVRGVARVLRISPNTVRAILKSGSRAVPPRERASRLDTHKDRLGELYLECRGNLVRVHEEIQKREGVRISYQALTTFCREHGIGVVPKVPAGRYEFEPGQEMQHDTSPHRVKIAGKERVLQCASLVLCFSRRVFAQLYPRFTRFECKLFLTAAARHLRGVADRCMIDNTHVVVLSGTGKDAVMAPEMAAFAERLGFHFRAHEKGDANRSAHVERRFWHIETNFYPGRTFADLADLNRQLIAWCEERFATYNDRLGAAPRDLFATEAPLLKPLPLHVPDVYRIERRQVDQEGFINLWTNRYSAPWAAIDRWLDVREYPDKVILQDGLDTLAVHPRYEAGAKQMSRLDEHKRVSGRTVRQERQAPIPAEGRLRDAGPVFTAMVELLRQKLPGRAVRALHRLEALRRDYPEAPLMAALEEALQYGLVDLGRIEAMILRRVAGDFFNLPYTRKDPKP
jgi:transposase